MPGDVDYERAGTQYSTHRRADPRIERIVHAALGDARSVVNAGAGSGSYEPHDRAVVARPERMLDPAVRAAQSAWTFVARDAEDRFVERLGTDLASGRWDERYGHLRTLAAYEGSLRLLIGTSDPSADPSNTT